MLAIMGTLVLLLTDTMGNAHLVPASQFRAADPGGCSEFYYGAANFTVQALDGATFLDPGAAACGYGLARNLPTFVVYDASPFPDTDFDGLNDTLENALGLDPNNPDTDGDGIPDGDEDTDLDGLSNNRELYEFQTDPTDFDTDDDGLPDSLSVALFWQSRTFTAAPTFVGAFTNAGIDVASMQEVVKKTNRLVRPLHLRFVPMGYAIDVVAGDQDMDGNLTFGEFRASQTFFSQLFDTRGHNGIYLGFGAEDYLSDFGGADGAVQFGSANLFAEWKLGAGFDLAQRFAANVFGHELFHFEGGEHPTPSSSDDVPTNILQPLDVRASYIEVNGLKDTTFPEIQLAKTQVVKPFRVTGRVFDHFDGTTTPYLRQIGRVSDDLGDAAGGSRFDIDQFYVWSQMDDDRIFMGGTLNWVALAGEQVALHLYVDSDGNVNTGLTGPAGAVGIEREVQFYLEQGMSGPITWTYFGNNDTFQRFPGSRAFFSNISINFANGDPVPSATGFLAVLSKQALGLSAPQVPFYLQTEPFDQPFAANDATSLVFDQEAYMGDPVLEVTTEAAEAPGAGDSVSFEVSGLTPSTSFDVLVGNRTVLSETTDGAGGFAGSFALPSPLSGGPRFVTAQDATGEFGATVLTTLPEPEATLAGLVALAALLGVRRRRR